MSRVLLEAENVDIWRAEVSQAMGTVQADRLVVRGDTDTTFTLGTLSIRPGEVSRVRTIVLGKQVGGTSGTVGNAASYEICGTFKNLDGTVTQIGTTTALITHEDDADWGVAFSIASNVLSLTVSFNGATASTGLHVVFNAYSYLHTLKAG